MRIQINLATRPFVELRPFFARLRIIMAALAVIAIGLAFFLHAERSKLVEADRQMDALRRRTIAAQQEKLANENRMRQPANATVLDRAHFLNALFLRKSFSWTAVMMDLETVLPTGVQVAAIEPAITTDGDVIIRLRVSGDRDRAIQLVRNLERSTRFVSPRLVGESAQSKEQASVAAQQGAAPGGVDFDILANYNPLPDLTRNVSEKESNPDATGILADRADRNKKPRTPRAVVRQAPPNVRPGPGDGIVLKPFSGPPAPSKGATR